MQRHRDSRHTDTYKHTLTQSKAESLHISSHSLHSAEKRLKCHKCSCSRRGQWQLSKLLLLPSLPPAPYHSHSLHISLTLLTLSLLVPLSSPVFLASFFLIPSLPLPLLSDLSFSLVQRLHNAHQLFRGSLPVSLAYPIRAGLCTNGLLLYLLPAPTHSQDSRGGDRQREQRRQPRRREDEKKR